MLKRQSIGKHQQKETRNNQRTNHLLQVNILNFSWILYNDVTPQLWRSRYSSINTVQFTHMTSNKVIVHMITLDLTATEYLPGSFS